MSTITRFDHPASLAAPQMFVLRAERDLWAEVLQAKVGELDMGDSAEMAFAYGTHPQYHRHIRLVASDVAAPRDEVWDAERVRASDDQLEMADRDQLQTLVRHVPSGQLVGFTRLFRDQSAPEVAHQWETLVVSAHRGHGLGMLMKVVSHAAVPEFWPEVSRLITGNASENSHMLAINTALGYEPYAASGFWELRHGALS